MTVEEFAWETKAKIRGVYTPPSREGYLVDSGTTLNLFPNGAFSLTPSPIVHHFENRER